VAARKLLISLRALPLKVEGAEERTLRAVEMLGWYQTATSLVAGGKNPPSSVAFEGTMVFVIHVGCARGGAGNNVQVHGSVASIGLYFLICVGFVSV